MDTDQQETRRRGRPRGSTYEAWKAAGRPDTQHVMLRGETVTMLREQAELEQRALTVVIDRALRHYLASQNALKD